MSLRQALWSVAGVWCLSVSSITIGRCTAESIPPSEFLVAEGFEVSLWATTPQLFNPTNFDIDGKGRIWVTEAVNYRNYRNADIGLENEAGDRVVVLEDTDADGKADSSHTFVRDKDLVAPLGIAVIGNKVVVSCAPNLLVYTDVDGDAVFTPGVDTKEVLLTGFGSLDHDHSLHSVTVGPDGYWYFNAGNGGPHTVTDQSGWTLRAGSSYAGGAPTSRRTFQGEKVTMAESGLVAWPYGCDRTGLALNQLGTISETSMKRAFHRLVTFFRLIMTIRPPVGQHG